MHRLFISLISIEIALIFLHLILRLSFSSCEKLANENYSIETVETYHQVPIIKLTRLIRLSAYQVCLTPLVSPVTITEKQAAVTGTIRSNQSIDKMLKVEDGTSNFRKKSGKNSDSMAKTTPKRWLVKLLADEKAVALLLVFLKDTEVGSRECLAEREME